jgi:hypothetical protein
MSLFDTQGCSCPSVVELARAGLHGEELEPTCKVHQVDEMRAFALERERREAVAEVDRQRQIYDSFYGAKPEPAPPTCSCNVRSLALAGLTGDTIEPCPVHRPYAEPAPTNDLALNSDELTNALAASVGAHHETPDLPPAA